LPEFTPVAQLRPLGVDLSGDDAAKGFDALSFLLIDRKWQRAESGSPANRTALPTPAKNAPFNEVSRTDI